MIGNAADSAVLEAANVAEAAWLLVAIPNVLEAGQVIEKARSVDPELRVTARVETEAERLRLLEVGADELIVGRRGIALAMVAEAFGDGDARPPPRLDSAPAPPYLPDALALNGGEC